MHWSQIWAHGDHQQHLNSCLIGLPLYTVKSSLSCFPFAMATHPFQLSSSLLFPHTNWPFLRSKDFRQLQGYIFTCCLLLPWKARANQASELQLYTLFTPLSCSRRPRSVQLGADGDIFLHVKKGLWEDYRTVLRLKQEVWKENPLANDNNRPLKQMRLAFLLDHTMQANQSHFHSSMHLYL